MDNVMVPADLKRETMRVAELTPYIGNAKKHPEWQVEQIADSIRAFGFNDPVAVWRDVAGHWIIVEGHGRVLAAKMLGMDEVPVVRLDHLDDEARRAYTLAHNKLTMNTDYDVQMLEAELDAIEGFDMTEFGFEAEESSMFSDEIEDAPVPDEAESRCKAGDVWLLGRHRLMCGDSTDPEAVAKLMDGGRADACFTSPPYNMAREAPWDTAPNKAMGAGRAYGEYSDDKEDGRYSALLCESLGNALEHADDALYNVGILHSSKVGVAKMMHDYAANLCDVLVWNKSQSLPHGMVSQRGMVSHRCELVFCFNQSGSRAFTHPQWNTGTMINRIDTANASGNEYAKEHAATFPVEFAAEVVRNFTESSVLDLFGGTGTTLIAAEQLGRRCYMMELDPHYCDIIIKRWEDFTGKEAVLDG